MKSKEEQAISWIPQRFLKFLNVKTIDYQQITQKKGSNISIFNILNTVTNESIGTIYKTIFENKDFNSQEIEQRIMKRKEIKFKIIPRILDFCIEKKEEFLIVMVLMEYNGMPFPEAVKNKEMVLENSLDWLYNSVQGILEMLEKGQLFLNIGPELLYVSKKEIKVLDLDEVLHNKNWTMSLNGLKKDDSWRFRRILKPFPAPLTLSKEEYFINYQVYMWANSFLYLSIGESIFQELDMELLFRNDVYIFPREKLNELMLNIIGNQENTKLASILGSCLTNYPKLCPSYKELSLVLSKFKEMSNEEINFLLLNKCGNCGEHVPEYSSQAACTKTYVCITCQKKQCLLCSKPHSIPIIETKSTEEMRIFIVNVLNNDNYEISKGGATLGRKKGNTICIIKLSFIIRLE